MKTCVVIPAYNEGKTIGGVIKEIRSQGLDVVVIDDGSKDNTSAIAQETGAAVLKNSNNEGKGASLIKGFNYAINRDFDAIICMDGDGQHHTDDIEVFMDLAENSNVDFLIGNRMQSTKDMPWERVLTNKIMSWFISRIAKHKIYDTQCGFRLIRRRVLEKIRLNTCKYETESEILLKAARLGFKIESVPIRTIYTGQRSQIHPVIDTLRFFRFIIRELWTTKH